MKRTGLWIAAAVILVALPAVIGLVALRGDDSSSESRRAAALIDAKNAGNGPSIAMPILPAGKAIDVLSYSWGVAQPASASAAAGAGAGKPSFADFSFTKTADASSAALLKACATGQHIPEVTLSVLRGNSPQPYLVIKFTDVIISGVQESASGNELPNESISLNYAKIEFTHSEEKPDGTLGGQTKMVYDLKQAKAS